LKVIHQVNIFYSENSKALEYFTTPMLEQALKSFKEFPKIKDFRKVAVKVNQFIVDNDYFINATTSEKPSQGIIAIN